MRLACDVTHFGGKKFLTMIDSGPSQFAIWRLLGREYAEEVAEHVDQIFREHGARSSSSSMGSERCVSMRL